MQILNIQPKPEKPRMRRVGENGLVGYGWLCTCSHLVVYGATPALAYSGWQEMHDWLKTARLVAQ